jgi:hypothetical protein
MCTFIKEKCALGRWRGGINFKNNFSNNFLLLTKRDKFELNNSIYIFL